MIITYRNVYFTGGGFDETLRAPQFQNKKNSGFKFKIRFIVNHFDFE